MKEFISVFQLSKTKVFEVNYYTLSTNSHPYFATCGAEFIRSKRDYSTCGQCQNYLLKHYPTAMAFYKKWDGKHLKDLTEEEYNEMRHDLKNLENKYNHIVRELDESKKPYSPHIGFYEIVEFSKQEPKRV